MQSPIVAPSLLAADFSCLSEGVSVIEKSAADWVHLDVMDGSFVPQITFGHKMVRDIRRITDLPLDVHLMVVHPENLVEDFCRAGADYVTVHAEASVHLHRLLTKIKELGCRAGVSIVPSTPVSAIQEVAPVVDMILIMTVNPGYGGQTIIPTCLEKVRKLKDLKNEKGYEFLIQVDGGINPDTCEEAIRAGSEVLVMGSAFFNDQDPASLIRRIKRRRTVKAV